MAKKCAHLAAILTISLFAAGTLYICGLTGYWDKALYDRCVNSRVKNGSVINNQSVASIDLDDQGIEKLGEALDTRRAFADILEVLEECNTKAVIDFLFRNEKPNDPYFINAVELAGNTVIAALAVEKEVMNQYNAQYPELTETERQLMQKHVWHIKVLNKGKVPEAGTFLLPFPALVAAAGQIGHINMNPDSDGIYRRLPLLYEWEGGYIPSLALAAAVTELRIPAENIELKAGEYLALSVPGSQVIRIPIDEKGCMLIPYTKTWKDDAGRIPFHTVVEAKNNDAIFDRVFSGLSGRIALLAEISTSQKDYGPAPFEQLFPLSGLHAEVIGSILGAQNERTFIAWPSLSYRIVSVLLLLIAAFLCSQIRSDAKFHFGFSLAILVFSGLTIFRWRIGAIAPWYSFPAILFFLFWLCAFLNRLFVRYREQLLLQNALSRYFPHTLAERIMREGKTELAPVYKELTILFSDISGFTKWSALKQPDEVHAFLSDYLESMAEIIFSHGGTVDKFMGDGILSFFGDPFELQNHTEQCVLAAIAMQKRILELAGKWKPLVDIDLKVRMGINTGKVIVGNLGNKTRIEYTVIGAAVNLAQRMESTAPLGGILVTADVREKVKDKFTFSGRQDITVKGYSETIEAYVVEGVCG